eukprot:277817-Rhodomonas_salina.1
MCSSQRTSTHVAIINHCHYPSSRATASCERGVARCMELWGVYSFGCYTHVTAQDVWLRPELAPADRSPGTLLLRPAARELSQRRLSRR